MKTDDITCICNVKVDLGQEFSDLSHLGTTYKYLWRLFLDLCFILVMIVDMLPAAKEPKTVHFASLKMLVWSLEQDILRATYVDWLKLKVVLMLFEDCVCMLF